MKVWKKKFISEKYVVHCNYSLFINKKMDQWTVYLASFASHLKSFYLNDLSYEFHRIFLWDKFVFVAYFTEINLFRLDLNLIYTCMLAHNKISFSFFVSLYLAYKFHSLINIVTAWPVFCCTEGIWLVVTELQLLGAGSLLRKYTLLLGNHVAMILPQATSLACVSSKHFSVVSQVLTKDVTGQCK